MTLPAATTKVNWDVATDDPKQARAEGADWSDKINSLITHLGLSPITNDPLTVGGGLEDGGTVLRTRQQVNAQAGASYTAVEADRDKLVNFTGTGAKTLILTAAATLTDGWICAVRNSGASGDVTIDPNAAETINGAATLVLTPGASALVWCNGTAFLALATTAAAQKVVQQVSFQDSAVATGTTNIPWDDTIPQNTEGDQFLTLSITPQNTANILRIEVTVFYGEGSSDHVTAALFQDAVAGAKAAVNQWSVAGTETHQTFTHTMVAGTVSSTAFKVRLGGTVGGTITFNGSASARIFGGVAASSIRITEFTP